MALILQIETSSEVCSVALSRNGVLLHCFETAEPNSHTSQLTLLIKRCIEASGSSISELSAVAVSDGPGSYTSLRVGAATAKGLCYVVGCPLIAIDSLFILANGISNEKIQKGDFIVPMIDARRMEVYTSVYNAFLDIIETTSAKILDDATFEKYQNKILHICGSGSEKFKENFGSEQTIIHHTTTSAIYMTSPAYNAFQAKQFSDLATYTPNYIKGVNITKSSKK